MKLTFPHMGNTYITVKALLDDLGAEYIVPPFNNKKALELGTKYAPELACLPLKLNIGNFIQAFEQGADTVLVTGGCGPCRAGYYCEMHREILADIGCKMDVIALELPDNNLKEFFRRIKKISGKSNIYKIIKAIHNASRVAIEVDKLENLTYKTRPIEIKKGSTDKIFNTFQNNVLKVSGSTEIYKLINQTSEALLSLETDKNMEPLKIGIVGEIYTTIDPFSNVFIDSKLGNLGVEVDHTITVSNYIIEHLLKAIIPVSRDLEYAKAAKPYLGAMIGGHAQETIGDTVLYAQKHYDGVIQIYPLTCMPEIVAESILPSIEKDFHIPVLTLIVDEMTGEAGFLTRIEAFIDLMQKKKGRNIIDEQRILSWN